MTIIITGAAGYIGRRLVRELLAKGVAASDLVLLTRSPDRLRPLAPQGAEIRYADYAEPDSLRAAFQGGDVILLLNTAPESHETWEDNVKAEQMGIRLAAEAKPRRIVLQSALGAHEDADPQEADDILLEQTLKDSGIAWTILRTAGFADSRGRDSKRVVQTGKMVVTDRQAPRAHVTRDDITSVIAAVLTTPGHENKAYSLVGPQVDQRDLVALLADIRGAPVEVEVLDPDAYLTFGIARGRKPGIAARGLRTEGRTFAGRPYPACDIERLTGRRPASLLDLLNANREELKTGVPPAGREQQFG